MSTRPATMSSTLIGHLDRPATGRGVAPLVAAALIGLAIIHLIDGPMSLEDTLYVGVLELALTAAAVPLAILLLVHPVRDVWIAVTIVVAAALACYLASRTVGLPGATDDIGNWRPTLGVLNIGVEVAVLGLAVFALSPRRPRAIRSAP